MIVSWNWLTEYVELKLSEADLVHRLMMAGFNHESTTEVDGDIAIDLEVTSNRPDCLGHLGVAREIAALTKQKIKLPRTDFTESDRTTQSLTSVEVTPEASAWCYQYRARVIEGVKVGPSPGWMQRRLKAVGIRPINNVVDITNYILLETGQPQHAFDLDQLAGKRVIVRNARDGETIQAIDHNEYKLKSWMPAIADEVKSSQIAGLMGSKATEINERTVNVFLEAAEFAPLTIRRTSRELNLKTDASYRYERKIDPLGLAFAHDRACHLLQELAGGKVSKGAIHITPPNFTPTKIKLRIDRVPRILGIEIARAEIVQTLKSLDVDLVDETSDSLTFQAPSFRRDLTREIDLIEEVGRIHGYDDVPEDAVIPQAISRITNSERIEDLVRTNLCVFGFCECVTFSFHSKQQVQSIRPWTQLDPLLVHHSTRKHENAMRQSLLPSLLQVLQFNDSKGNEHIDLFEIAHTYLPGADGSLPTEPRTLAIVTRRDFRTLRGLLDAIFARLRVQVEYKLAPVIGFESDSSATLLLDGQVIGVIGKISQQAMSVFELNDSAFAVEIQMKPLEAKTHLEPNLVTMAETPAMTRDFAFVLDEQVRWADLESTARIAAGPLLEQLAFVDLYRGNQIPAGKKSIALRLVYRDKTRTLTREEVDQYQESVRQAVADKLGGTLRS